MTGITVTCRSAMAPRVRTCYGIAFVRALLFMLLLTQPAFGGSWPSDAAGSISRKADSLTAEMSGPSTPLRLAKAIGKLEEVMISSAFKMREWYGAGMPEPEFRCLAAMIFADSTLKPAELLGHSNLFRSKLRFSGDLADAAQRAYVIQRDARDLLTDYLQQPGLLRESLKKTTDTITIDALLGIERVSREFAMVDPANYSGEQIYPENWVDLASSTYEAAQRLLNDTNPNKDDVVWDLGCGYGRILLYGAVLHPETQFKGVDIVGPRLDVIRNAMKSRNITNIEVVHKSVMDTDYSDGTIFFLFAPFPDRMDAVSARLSEIGRKKFIRIYEYKTRMFDPYSRGENPWLRRNDNIWESIVLP